MRWFNHPSKSQVAFLNKHVGRKVIELYCGPEPLFDLCQDLSWAIGVDKEDYSHLSHVNGRKDIQRELVQKWIPEHEEEWATSDTVIMCYPPNNDLRPSDAMALQMMHKDQTLILVVPRPWHNLMVAGSHLFWQHLFSDFWLYGASEITGGNLDIIYSLGKRRIDGAQPAIAIMEGHKLFELQGDRLAAG